MIAIDGGEGSQHIVERAHALFGADANLLLVSVGPGPTAYPVTAIGAAPTAAMWIPWPVEAETELAERRAEQSVIAAKDVDLADVEVLSASGEPGAVICELAEQRGVDVVVVGALDRGWLSRIVQPSIGHYVVDHAPCDVLVVRAASS